MVGSYLEESIQVSASSLSSPSNALPVSRTRHAVPLDIERLDVGNVQGHELDQLARCVRALQLDGIMKICVVLLILVDTSLAECTRQVRFEMLRRLRFFIQPLHMLGMGGLFLSVPSCFGTLRFSVRKTAK